MRQHRSPLRRCASGFAALVLAATGVAVAPQPAQAAACSGSTGVTVVVDFTAFAGAAATECALGDPTSGIDALQDAGFSVTGTVRWGLAFVCRIDGLPTPAADPCYNTPPANAYWSYWYAQPGGTWTYSAQGAAYRDPVPGTVEGWAFGSGSAPSIPPP